ncbi:nickel-dependent lactate racemase [Desulfosporosinus metallidurans]|uniref:Transcriptional regulator n=1 Tax=Desulfosporosinus metallidurans TaxID=1888891 RepID=A0A1Q8QZE5_9FIRM|nr:nickel-dependent lactate racemase [Desulfosporosinus metallidurans]OLN32723.1 Transcriptional regulator [Desulfosporosinus metallidurans]
MKLNLGFGKDVVEVNITETNLLGVLEPNRIDLGLSGQEEVKRAIRDPIGTQRLKDIVKKDEKVVIITSDITRPMPSKVVLLEIVNELREANVELKNIKIVFALGCHRKHTEDEKRYLIGDELYNQIECIDSDGQDYVNMGITSSGTPVDIFRPVAEADRRICLGNIEYHYFAGYSGGIKAIMPGVSTRAAIQANHSKMVKDEAKAGEMLHNPVRRDIDEVANFVTVDYILNVVLDEHKTIIKAVAGHYLEAHRKGCLFLDKLYKAEIPERADVVVVSPGGYPKDINLYQAQKALDNAKHAVKDGGVIVLVASCIEGFGEKVFERWITNAQHPEDLIEGIQQNFELGGHKAAAIAMVLKKVDIYLVSELSDETVRKVFMKPYTNVQTALDDAVKRTGENSKIIVMPFGGSTLPEVVASGENLNSVRTIGVEV